MRVSHSTGEYGIFAKGNDGAGAVDCDSRRAVGPTAKLNRTKLRVLRLLVLGGIIESQNSDFVTP